MISVFLIFTAACVHAMNGDSVLNKLLFGTEEESHTENGDTASQSNVDEASGKSLSPNFYKSQSAESSNHGTIHGDEDPDALENMYLQEQGLQGSEDSQDNGDEQQSQGEADPAQIQVEENPDWMMYYHPVNFFNPGYNQNQQIHDDPPNPYIFSATTSTKAGSENASSQDADPLLGRNISISSEDSQSHNLGANRAESAKSDLLKRGISWKSNSEPRNLLKVNRNFGKSHSLQ